MRTLPSRSLPLLALAIVLLLATSGIAWAVTGELSYSERAPEYDFGTARDVTASPAGETLYVLAAGKLTVLDRDPASGELEYLETERDKIDDPEDEGDKVAGLNNTRSVVVSADGESVYVASYQNDDALVVFDRDTATGRISYIETEQDDVDDPGDPGGMVTGMFRPEALAVTPDGGNVYVVTGEQSLVSFERNPTTGEVSYVKSESLPGAGRDIVVTSDSKAVYVCGIGFPPYLSAYSRDPEDGALTLVETEEHEVDDPEDDGDEVEGLAYPSGLDLSFGDDLVFAVDLSGDAVAMFERDPESDELSFLEAEVNGEDDPDDSGGVVSSMGSPADVAASADGGSIYVPALGSDAIVVFDVDAEAGELSFREAQQEGVKPAGGGNPPSGLNAPADVAVPSDGGNVYAIGENSGLARFVRDGIGPLKFAEAKPAQRFLAPRGFGLTPNGEHALVTAYQSLHSLARDPVDGSLQPLDTERNEVDDPSDGAPEALGLYEPHAVTVAPNGTDVYVVDGGDNAVSLYRLDPESGELGWVETEFDEENDPEDKGGEVQGLYEPHDVVVSNDGRGVFVVGSYADALVAFDRDPATGKLSYVETEEDGVDGVSGLDEPEALAISPDGLSLYTGGSDGEVVAVFARDPETNLLTFVESETNEVDDATDAGPEVTGLEYLHDVVVDPRGEQVYFAGELGVTRFERGAVSGALSFAETVNPNDDPGAPEGPSDYFTSLELSGDGSELYVGLEQTPGTLYVHPIGPSGEILPLIDVEQSGVDDPDDPGPAAEGLNRLSALAISPDDRHLYTVSEKESGVGIFERQQPPAGKPNDDGDDSSDSAPAPPVVLLQPPPDRLLLGARIRAPRRQVQRRRNLALKVWLRAAEPAHAVAWGQVKVGGRKFGLKPARRFLPPGRTRVVRLTPPRGKQRKQLARLLRRRGKLRAVLKARIVDFAGNRLIRTLPVVAQRGGGRR